MLAADRCRSRDTKTNSVRSRWGHPVTDAAHGRLELLEPRLVHRLGRSGDVFVGHAHLGCAEPSFQPSSGRDLLRVNRDRELGPNLKRCKLQRAGGGAHRDLVIRPVIADRNHAREPVAWVVGPTGHASPTAATPAHRSRSAAEGSMRSPAAHRPANAQGGTSPETAPTERLGSRESQGDPWRDPAQRSSEARLADLVAPLPWRTRIAPRARPGRSH